MRLCAAIYNVKTKVGGIVESERTYYTSTYAKCLSYIRIFMNFYAGAAAAGDAAE